MTQVQNLRRARNWVEQSGGELFPTFSSFEWFTRTHRAALIRSGQFYPGGGRRGSLVGPEFDQVVLEILRQEAEQQEVA